MKVTLEMLQTIALLCQVPNGATTMSYPIIERHVTSCQASYIYCIMKEEDELSKCVWNRYEKKAGKK